MALTHTVVKGDSLWKIAENNKSIWVGTFDTINKYIDFLADLNNLTDPDYIVVGQVIKLASDGTEKKPNKNVSTKVIISRFGLQSNSSSGRVLYITWRWDRSHTKEYLVRWQYDTGDGIWFTTPDSTVTVKQHTYDAPANAKRVRVAVKPVSTAIKVNGKTTTWWKSDWTSWQVHSFNLDTPDTPGTPNLTRVEGELNTLEASIDNAPAKADTVEFQIAKDDVVWKSMKVELKTSSASWAFTVPIGSEYKARCRAINAKLKSEWSKWSSAIGTAPNAPSAFTKCIATSATSVQLRWKTVKNAKTYEFEYTTKRHYFDGSNQIERVSSIEGTTYELTGLTSGQEYFFRLRAINNNGESGWGPIASVVLGKKPAAPTTWSSTTTAMLEEPIYLYWVHNTGDGSSQVYGDVEVYVGEMKYMYTFDNLARPEEDRDKTSSYKIPYSFYKEGSTIQWRVRTCGITREYGEWSVMRTIKVYAQPSAVLNVIYKNPGDEMMTSFPLTISASAFPTTQTPIGWQLTISANEAYETEDNVGNQVFISAGEVVYSQYFDLYTIVAILNPGDVNLENNQSYTIKCTVVMDSGLTAEATREFSVAWEDVEYAPNAAIAIDEDNYSASIRPYLVDENDIPMDGVKLSVYRREYDGTFTELMTGIPNGNNTFITDPHPSLDYARYRVVAIDDATGSVSYADIPGVPVDCPSIVVQWDEEWRTFDTTNEDALAEPEWTGSLLKLPYNVDVSDTYTPDVEHVEYIGRTHPVGYHGTQIGHTASWGVMIPKEDTETLYGLRRLARWMGDVYVREPSGGGYWATVQVSISQKHLEVAVPVTLTVTRVEGGI